MEKTPNNNQHSYMITISVMIAVLGVLIGIAWYVQHNIARQTEINLALQNDVNEKQRALQYTARLRRIITNTEIQRNKINQYFVNPDTINTFFNYLEYLGDHSNVTTIIKSASIYIAPEKTQPDVPSEEFVDELAKPSTTKPSSRTTPLLVQLTAEGDFKDISKFLVLIENIPYQSRIDNLTIHREEEVIKGTNDKYQIWVADFSLVLLSFINN